MGGGGGGRGVGDGGVGGGGGGVYWWPMSEAVSKAMRMLSVEPLTEGVPCHCATDGIFSNSSLLPLQDSGTDGVACAPVSA